MPYLYVADNNGKLCVANKFASTSVWGEMYSWGTEIFFFIIPFPSLLLMNSVIMYTLMQRSKQNMLGSVGQGQSHDENDARNAKKIKQLEKQVLTMVLLITFAFLILNIPARTLTYYINYYNGDSPKYHAGLYLFYQIGEKCHYTNHGINFFLYVTSGKKFRSDLRNLFSCKSRRKEIKTNNSHTATSVVSTNDNAWHVKLICVSI